MEKLKILILEDNKLDAELIKEELIVHKFDFISILIETKKDFITAIHDFKPDIILSDYSLPQFTGFEALEITKELIPDIPFIIVTGSLSEETAVNSIKRGAWDYIIKENLLRLTPAIENALKLKEGKDKNKRAEEALRASRDYLENLTNSMWDVVFSVKMPERVIEWVNDSFRLIGYEPSECIGKDTAFLYPNKDGFLDFGKKLKDAIAAGKDVLHTDQLLKRKSGETFPAEITVTFHRENDKIVSVTSIVRDITERKQAEEELQQSESKYRTLVEHLPAITYIAALDETSTTFYVSPQIEKILGISPEKYKANPDFWVKHLHDEDRERVLRELSHAHEIGKSFVSEYRMISTDNRIVWLMDKAIIFKNDKGDPLYLQGVMFDITERKKAEEEKEKMQSQLLQLQKMEVVGTLTGGVAHDFNNILTAIQGHAELAAMKVDEANPIHKNLKQIYFNVERAANLTRQLLLFSRKQAIQPILLDVNKTIDNELQMISRLIGEDIVVNTDLAPDLWIVKADEGNIEQVIMNLAVNARDAMSEGGKLIIKTGNITLDEEYSKCIIYARPGKFICLSVEDSGAGMDKETIQHIFEPFFSTKETGKGTGLGLAVVYGIIKEHKGWINVYSEPGHGSTFKIYLPAIFENLETEDEIKEEFSLSELQGNGERILLVEDDEDLRKFAITALHENGYVVFEAANVKEALDIFKKEKGDFHLVFSDVVLPDQSGLELVEQFLSHKPKLRVLLSSGYLDKKSQWPIIRERGFPFLQKPYSLANLLKAIKKAVKDN